ncbi:MAG: hypothetical protein FWF73_04480 [Spirochaetes bacterium]|nr:hypothetical protein [Spirochaetota bacterium]
MKIKIALLLITVVTIAGISCSLFQTEVDDGEDFLPKETDVPGWIRSNSILSYSGGNIKKYNKDYAGLGIEKFTYSIYESINNSDIKIKVEVMRFDSVLNAYGFYSVKRGQGIFDIRETNDFSSDRLSVIQIGNYVVCSSTDSSAENGDSSLHGELKTFSKIPFNYIGENYMNYKLPDSLHILKSGDGYGIIYSINQHAKFSFLERMAYTQWKWNNNLISVFYSEYGSFYDAYEVFKKNIVDTYIVSSSDGIYTAFKKDDEGKYIFISVKDRWIFGAWSIEEYNEINRIHSEILNKINDYNKKNVK